MCRGEVPVQSTGSGSTASEYPSGGEEVDPGSRERHDGRNGMKREVEKGYRVRFE